MHLKRQHVVSDLTGETGMALRRAILAGERDPATLAALKDYRIKASTDTIAKSLEGSWREELLFNLRQSLERYEYYQQNIAECDTRIEAHLLTVDRKIELPDHPLPTPKRRPKKARRHEPTVDLHTQLYRISGVDLTRIDGIEVLTAQTLIAEIGLDLSRWKTEQHFASWLG